MFPRISQGRRLLGITIDWVGAYAVSLGFFAGSGSLLARTHQVGALTTIAVMASEYALLVWLTGSSFGHRVVRLKVVRFSDGGALPPLQVVIRTILLILLVTAITFDENGRGINERISNSVLVRI